MSGTLERILQDLAYGLRSMLRTPLLSAAAILTMALGIGVVSTLYAAFDVWLLRALPLPHAEQLATVFMANRESGGRAYFSVPDFQDWRNATESVELAVHTKRSMSLVADGDAQRVTAIMGSWNLLRVLGLEPNPGRAFLPEEERAESARAVILTEGFRQRALGGDPDVVGRRVVLEGEAYTVVGILPDGPRLPEFAADVWVPLTIREHESRDDFFLPGIARVKPGLSLAQAREELDAVAAEVAKQDPEERFPNAYLVPLREDVYGGLLQEGGLALMAAVVFVLLIACANLANLLLARGIGRGQELALRSALGASRGRIFRQLLSESLLVTALGGMLGVALASVGVGLLLRFVLWTDIPGWDQIAVDARVVGGTALLTVVAGLGAGLVPAFTGSRPDLRSRLQQGGDGFGGTVRSRKGHALVAGEITLALTLLVLTGLLTKSLVGTYAVDVGLRSEGLLSFRVSPPATAYPGEEDVSAFHQSVRDAVLALPGVTNVASSNGPAVGMGNSGAYRIVAEDGTAIAGRRSAQDRVVTDGYLGVMGMSLLAGRWFAAGVDEAGGEAVAVVSRALAEIRFPLVQQALGARVEIMGRSLRIVGVADVGRAVGPQSPPPELIFESVRQRTVRSMYYVVDAGEMSQALGPAVRAAVHRLDPTVAVYDLETVKEQIAYMARGQIAALRLFGALAALAMILTLVGVYGVMAHEVGRRRREFGIRLALGAERGDLVSHTLVRSGKVVGIGLILGVVLSVLAGRSIGALLVDVSFYDPVVLGVVTTGMLAVALLASYLPARWGSRVDPVDALSSE